MDMTNVFDKLIALQEILADKYEIESKIENAPKDLGLQDELLVRMKEEYIKGRFYPRVKDYTDDPTPELLAVADVVITDYSSIVFDSVYMNCPIIYFVPDYEQFRAGVSHNYRKLDLPLENGFGPFAQDAQSLLAYLEEYVNNGFVPKEPYASKMKDFFLYRDNNCCDRVYEGIK